MNLEGPVTSTEVFNVFLCLQANAEMVAQDSKLLLHAYYEPLSLRFKFIRIYPLALKLKVIKFSKLCVLELTRNQNFAARISS